LLTYYAKQLVANGHYFSVVAVADGDAHDVSVSAATTAPYVPGEYRWVAIVTSGSEAKEVGTGSWKILPRYDTAGAYDDRSDAQIRLDDLWTAYESFQGAIKSYSIAGRVVQFDNRDQIRAEITYLEQKVQREKIMESVKEGRGNPTKFFASFR
jgi:hypothetical protein